MSPWAQVALGDLGAGVRHACVGGPFGSELTTKDYIDGPGVPVIRGSNLREDGFVDDGFVYVSEQKAEALRQNQARPGDIAFTQRGTIGQVAIIPATARYERYVLSQSQMKLTPDLSRVDPRFIVHYFRSPAVLSFLKHNTLATGVPHINLSILRRVPVPLPPVSEQCHIADILDKADAIRRKRKEAIALTDEILRSTFLEMFGDPVTNPMKWPRHALDEAIERLEAGWSANGEARIHEPGEFGVLKVSAVTSGVFRPEEHKAIAANTVDRELVTPRKGDLLFSRANTRELVAATCLVPADFPTLFLPDKLWRITPNPRRATAEFIKFVLSHERLRLELTKTATGTSGSMLNISMDKLRALKVPLPPLESQVRFSSVVWGAMRMKETQQQSEHQCEELFAALVDRAFRGKLSEGPAC